MSDQYNLKQHIRTVNDFPIDGITFRDITSLIEHPEAFVETCNQLTKISKSFNATSIASIESRGFIFAGSIAIEPANINPLLSMLAMEVALNDLEIFVN